MHDRNNDALNDEFEAKISFSSNANDIKDIQFFIFFDYGLNVFQIQYSINII